MKKEQFKPIKIGYNSQLERDYKNDIKAKIDAFNSIKDYVNNHIEEMSVEELYNNPFEYVKTEIVKFYEGQFKGISFHKIAFLIDMDVNHLTQLVDKLESINESINPITLEPIGEPDFNIYTISEDENKLYYALQQMVKGMNLFYSVQPSNQLMMMQGVKFDAGNKVYSVNTQNILNTRRSRTIVNNN